MKTIMFKNPIYIADSFSVVGPKEGDGALCGAFDIVLDDDVWCEKSFEKCECKMVRTAIMGAIKKSGHCIDDMDVLIGGDLLNQIVATNLSARCFSVPYLGIYNACATFTEGLILGSILIDGGYAGKLAVSSSSHYATAERQYRYPLELGNQRKPTAQWTVTGSGCTVLTGKLDSKTNCAGYAMCAGGGKTLRELIEFGKEFEDKPRFGQLADKHKRQIETVNREKSKIYCCAGQNLNLGAQQTDCDQQKLDQSVNNVECDEQKRECDKHKVEFDEQKSEINEYKADFRDQIGQKCQPKVKIVGACVGKVVDFGIKDESNMGAVMAPSAHDTIMRCFTDTNTSVDDYDVIVTGDLGRFGSEMLTKLLSDSGCDIKSKHFDTGSEIFNANQRAFQGGSGAGCIHTVFSGHILDKLRYGEWKKILMVATGALLNQDSPLQKESIPGVSHAVIIEVSDCV